MTISATTQGLRPGVCTSTSRPSTPFDGQVIYETDTNRVLVWDNSAWVMIADTDTPPGSQLIKTQTIGTAVSSVTVTDAFSADFDNYKIVISGGVGSASDGELEMTLGSSTTGYYYQLIYGNYTSNAPLTVGAANTTKWVYVGALSTDSLSANIDVISPFLSKYTYFHSGIGRLGVAGFTSGHHRAATSYTSFTLAASSGTLTGGTIRVYGYRNS